MPSRFNFQNVGSAATDELTRLLAEREVKRRQDFLDSITQQNSNRADEQVRLQQEFQRQQLEDQSFNREAIRADKEEQDSMPGDILSPTLAKHRPGLGVFQPGQVAEGQLNVQPTSPEVEGSIEDIQSRPTQGTTPGILVSRGGSGYRADRQAAQERADREAAALAAKPGRVGSMEEQDLAAYAESLNKPIETLTYDERLAFRRQRNQVDDRPRQDPRGRYSIQPVTKPDGTIGLVRIDMDSGDVLPVNLGEMGAGKPSDAQRGALAFFERASAADENAGEFEDQLEGLGAQLQVKLPSFMTSEIGQRYQQAQREFTEARLRKESGAAIPISEFVNDAKTYFVQPNDTEATIRQKQAARQRIRRGLRQQSGNLGATVPESTPRQKGQTKTTPHGTFVHDGTGWVKQ